jgi:hypothetical protein
LSRIGTIRTSGERLTFSSVLIWHVVPLPQLDSICQFWVQSEQLVFDSVDIANALPNASVATCAAVICPPRRAFNLHGS